MRILAVLAALVLAFLAAVAVIAMLDITDLNPCMDANKDPSLLNDQGECFDGSSTRKTLSLILGWPGAVLAVLSVPLMLAFAIRGRGGRSAIGVVVLGAVLFGLAILIGSI